MGGNATTAGRSNDVWLSTDQGATWSQMTASAEWSVRQSHASVTLPDGSIVVLGGHAAGTGAGQEVWRSTDQGATWSQLAGDVGWPELRFHCAATLADGSIVIMGGYDGSVRRNEVWRLETAGSYEQHPSHTYAEPGVYAVTLQAYNAGGYSRARHDAYITVDWLTHLPLLMR